MRILLVKHVGKGDTVLFWLDVWYGNCPLALQFPILFAKAKYIDTLTVAQVWGVQNTID